MNPPVVVHHNDPPDPDRERVYVGRAVPRKRVKASIWRNQYRVGPDGTGPEVLEKYRGLIRSALSIEPYYTEALFRLEGKELACWCRHRGETEPPCHGDVLIELFTERFGGKPE